MSARAAERLPSVPGNRGSASAPALCLRAAQLLTARSATEFAPDADRLAAVLAAAATSLTARPGSITSRLAATAMRSRIVDLAESIVGQQR